ncbi:hypothetical protein SARC_04078 [Sphaeroforma arctica JP610]|uniref:Uncharacterized protein n=1 Tax=Sphaeroforma arctica JP610 TaxID=667725 RepID=A0A0L0G3Q8_9EUKA|nr:hypothetical protein SARC_04078 [Sphaeroforma arctica JP610]KNC83680.1 hypothetical protein SARC_04078 [Sphaeroforma arctica JP610]|eukprot:XP_014157582.1 hypothetical protein SARC_04078 [Sphaeroforma arctica JP610]
MIGCTSPPNPLVAKHGPDCFCGDRAATATLIDKRNHQIYENRHLFLYLLARDNMTTPCYWTISDTLMKAADNVLDLDAELVGYISHRISQMSQEDTVLPMMVFVLADIVINNADRFKAHDLGSLFNLLARGKDSAEHILRVQRTMDNIRLKLIVHFATASICELHI